MLDEQSKIYQSRIWTSDLRRALPTELNSPILAVSILCQYLCSGGASQKSFNRRISNWASPRTSALKPRLSVSSHNTDARQTIERLTLSSYSACVNTENLVIKPGSAHIDVNFVNLKFVYHSLLKGLVWTMWPMTSHAQNVHWSLTRNHQICYFEM